MKTNGIQSIKQYNTTKEWIIRFKVKLQDLIDVRKESKTIDEDLDRMAGICIEATESIIDTLEKQVKEYTDRVGEAYILWGDDDIR